ncbi:uncharacterized protein LOC129806329 [Phlebotomus papatasi]|uniref:uncharacterized protein LOC129806329 n=1 Tax=Phlebotomus papatasi TaxID=29031 RepID=UPI002483F549|nr:uncharacterized protein LOC129806329 [Phlebotomus papatasi]
MDECLQVEQELSQLIAAITTQKRGYNAAGEASGLNTSSENQTVQQMLSLMQQQLQEQRLQRLSEESKLKELLQNQRKEVETLLEASRNNLTATLENSDILDVSDHSAKLEPIKIPTFSGDYCEWMTFKNLFISSVDKNIRLSKSQKMQYLRNSTSGEALGLFGSLPITDENYTIAWGRLEKRYNNKMIIISAFMDKFLNQPTITKSDVTALRKLQSTTSQALEAVDALGVSSRDPWLIHLALKHLDHQTQTQWSEKCPDSIPTWTDFDEFLEKRCRSLESCPITQKTSTVDEVIEAKQQLQSILGEASMKLSKFRSNRIELLATEDPSTEAKAPLVLDEEAKTLGILWNPVIDAFQFRVSGSLQSETWTKRQLLSTVARIFDPCGLIGPIITSAKLLIQIAWTKPIGWDDPIPDDLLTEWKAFIVDLTDISQLRIPRWISTISNPSHMELHAYCDASMMAYGASIYLVYEDSQCNRSSGLLVAKSRLTPIKGKHDCTRTLTIPKAELCGAELAAQLMSTVSEALKIPNTFFWTDSMVVLHWIYAPHGRKDTLVRNKVSKILSSSHSHQWRHVKTSENPADMISRGSKVKSLLDNSMWWHGPSWLLQGPSEWPPEFSPTSHLDFRPTMVTCSEVSAKRPWLSIYEALMLHCSSFVKATRVLVWVLRGVQRFKSRRQRVTRSTSCAIPDHLQVAELRTSEMLLVSWDQASHFKDVLALLKSNQLNKITLPIRKLSPFIDHDGILRVGGRLKNSEQSFETCHPALIGSGKLSEWIAQREHQRLLHAGPQLTLSSIRAKFWPLKGRNLVRSIIHRCTTCIRAKPQCAEQLMGDLPSSRTTLLRPFLHTGMDFTGHILIRRSPRGSVAEKAYVVVFICMSTKAVHLELITSLSSAAFIATFRRFIARRGLPAHIYSDNGTNFVGGEKELRNLLRNHNVQQDLANFSSTLHVQWHFNPPGAPHQGGLWEAAVKSFKTHFMRVVGNVRLTYEELNTIIVQIEAVLNSRPLIALMDDPNDPRSLTPGDFLVGNAPTQLPVDPGDVVNVDHLNRWRLCSKLQHDLTTRWKNDYLHTLQQRNKWNKETPNFTEGDVVLLKTENMSSLEWPLGLVVDVFPGSDGKVRVAQLRVRGKLITRPITKLIKLPVDES